MKVGWMSDTHVHYDESAGYTQAAIQDEYNWMIGSGGCDLVFHAGDAVHSNTGSPDRMDDYDTFFGAFDSTSDGGDSLDTVIPGNHEAPLATFLDSDPRASLSKRVDYDSDDLTVIYLNTQAQTQTYAGPDRRSGIATEIPRVPRRDVEWLDEQLATANTAKLVVPHASPYPLNGSGYSGVTRAGKLEGTDVMEERATYNVVQNFAAVHDVLSSYTNVVVPVSHLYSFTITNSGYLTTIDGVDYIAKNHSVEVPNQTHHQFGTIDIDGTGATVRTINHGDKTTAATPLDTTF